MSNDCAFCRFGPLEATGVDACPLTTLYCDFRLRHEARPTRNQRMALQVKNLARLKPAARAAIQQRADETKTNAGARRPPMTTC